MPYGITMPFANNAVSPFGSIEVKLSLKLGLLILLVSFFVTGCAVGKKIIGATADMSVEGTGIHYIARIDTGAGRTSLNAKDIVVEASNGENMHHDVGKMVSFTTENAQGQSKRLTAKIVGINKVTNSQGVERRYIIKLNITYHGETRKVRVNLRDRSSMEYKLLIGRDWLKGHYMVDVETARS